MQRGSPGRVGEKVGFYHQHRLPLTLHGTSRSVRCHLVRDLGMCLLCFRIKAKERLPSRLATFAPVLSLLLTHIHTHSLSPKTRQANERPLHTQASGTHFRRAQRGFLCWESISRVSILLKALLCVSPLSLLFESDEKYFLFKENIHWSSCYCCECYIPACSQCGCGPIAGGR